MLSTAKYSLRDVILAVKNNSVITDMYWQRKYCAGVSANKLSKLVSLGSNTNLNHNPAGDCKVSLAHSYSSLLAAHRISNFSQSGTLVGFRVKMTLSRRIDTIQVAAESWMR